MRPIHVAILSASLLAACGQPDDHEHPQLTTGRQLYLHHCAPCHRDEGTGSFPRGVPGLKDMSMTYRQMTDHIRGKGRAPASRMPEFSTMPKAEAEAIAVYIRSRLRSKLGRSC